MASKAYNQKYYQTHRKKLIREEKNRRQRRRAARITRGERLRLVYKTTKKNKYGQSICKHDKECYRCKKCGGGGVCEHKERRYMCLFCSPVGWAKRVLRDQRRQAREGGYTAPKITPEKLAELRKEAKICVLCEQTLEKVSPLLHHNHTSGIVVGFTHRGCNTAEGLIEKLSSRAKRIFIRNLSS